MLFPCSGRLVAGISPNTVTSNDLCRRGGYSVSPSQVTEN